VAEHCIVVDGAGPGTNPGGGCIVHLIADAGTAIDEPSPQSTVPVKLSTLHPGDPKQDDGSENAYECAA
jgi:hypothetical protein